MNPIKVSVVVVPVAAFPLPDRTMELLAYRPEGAWLAAPASKHLGQVASDLVFSAGPTLVDELPGWRPTPEPVTFVESAHGIALVFTVAVPMTTPMVDGAGRTRTESAEALDWVRVARGRSRSSHEKEDPILHMVLRHWRQALTETTAAFDLLPRYFTTPQVRALYEAVHGQGQDPGNFHKWLHGQRPQVCVISDSKDITAEAERVGKKALDHLPALAALSVRSLAPKSVGMSPAGVAAGVFGPLVGAAAVGAVVGGLVAYQAARQPGKQPDWYTRTAAVRIPLSTPFSSRP